MYSRLIAMAIIPAHAGITRALWYVRNMNFRVRANHGSVEYRASNGKHHS